MPTIAVIDVGHIFYVVGVLGICTVEPTKRLSFCCIPISCEELDQLYFIGFTNTILNSFFLQLSRECVDQPWHKNICIQMSNIKHSNFSVKSSHVHSQTFQSNSKGWVESSASSVSSPCFTWWMFSQKCHCSFFAEWIFDLFDVLVASQQLGVHRSKSFSLSCAHLLKLFDIHISLMYKFVSYFWTKFPSMIGCGQNQNLWNILSKLFGNCRFCRKFFIYWNPHTHLFQYLHGWVCQIGGSLDVRSELEYDSLAL